MALLRLAGGAFNLLRKPGVVSNVAKGLAADAALVGGVTAVPAAIGTGLGLSDGSLIDDATTRLSKQDRPGNDYRIGVGDRALSTLSKFLGGEGIDQDTIKAKKTLIRDKELKDLYKDDITAFGGTYKPGLDKGTYARQLDDAKAEYARKRTTEAPGYIDQKEAQTYRRGKEKEAQTYRRGKEEESRLDRLSREKQARLDSIDNRESSYNQAMAELDFKKGQSNREFDYQDRVLDYKSKQRKAERMQQIAMALGALPGLFGV